MEGVPDRPEKLLFSSGGMDRTALLYESLSALIRLDHLHADLHPFRQQCAGIAYFGRVRRRAGRYALSDVGGCDRYFPRSEEHTSELQSRGHLVCRLLLE